MQGRRQPLLLRLVFALNGECNDYECTTTAPLTLARSALVGKGSKYQSSQRTHRLLLPLVLVQSQETRLLVHPWAATLFCSYHILLGTSFSFSFSFRSSGFLCLTYLIVL